MPGAWLEAVRQGRGELPRVVVPKGEQATEYLLMSMRLAEGMDVARYERLEGRALDGRAVAELTDMGLVEMAGGRLKATASGRPVLNAILRALA